LRLVPGESVVINGQAAGNLLAELGGMTATALNAPDSYGRVALEIDAREVAHRRVPKQMDTYSPQWNGLVLNDVDISRATVRVRLSEWDPVTDDPIGTCELRAHVLVAAARANETVLVPCGKETAGRFLLLRLSVQKQAVPTSERTAQP
jgi:hypothetical protein